MPSPIEKFIVGLLILFGGFYLGITFPFNTAVKQVTCLESQHLLAGSVVEKYSETVEKEKFYYVTIAGKVDGKYHTRNVEVNKWMWIHSIQVGDYWTGN